MNTVSELCVSGKRWVCKVRLFYGFPYDKEEGKKLRNLECMYVIGIVLEFF